MTNDRKKLTPLASDELMAISGGAERYTCALLGGLTVAAAIGQQWWAVGGALVASYANGCFR
jgi:hypothetical protein